jgi:hypothetical protein
MHGGRLTVMPLQKPLALRKVEMPESADIPAPVKNT